MEFLNSLGSSLSERVGGILPGVFGALAVLVIGLFLAGIIKRIVLAVLSKTNIDDKIGDKLSFDFRLDKFIAKLVYYLIVVYVLLMVLSMMGIDSVLVPLQNMMGEFLSFLPNIIAGGIIGFAGYIIASLASEAVGFISNTLEGLSTKIGWNSSVSLTKIVKQLVFIFVFIPILIVALDALNMKAISEPATEMLNTFLNAIPNILAAVIVVGIFYIVGKYVVSMVVELMQNLGVDDMGQKMGLANIIGDTSIATLLGNVAFFFIMFTGIIAGVDKLGLDSVSELMNNIFNISGKVFFGILILAAGGFIANIAGNALSKSSANKTVASIAQFAIIGIFLAFALHTMGIAESIVNLAFGLTLGAVAVAFALSFGLGGRAAAGKQMESFFEDLRKK